MFIVLFLFFIDNAIQKFKKFLNSPKLRRILRKALYIAKYDFEYKSPEKLIEELSKQIAEQLYDVFPEIGNSLSQVCM